MPKTERNSKVELETIKQALLGRQPMEGTFFFVFIFAIFIVFVISLHIVYLRKLSKNDILFYLKKRGEKRKTIAIVNSLIAIVWANSKNIAIV